MSYEDKGRGRGKDHPLLHSLHGGRLNGVACTLSLASQVIYKQGYGHMIGAGSPYVVEFT